MRPYLNAAVKLDPFLCRLFSNLSNFSTVASVPVRLWSPAPTPRRIIGRNYLGREGFLQSCYCYCCCRRCIRRRAMGTSSVTEQEPVRVEVKDTIELTEIEGKIFDRLLNTLRHFNLSTVLRVAGGWVRDKLLGKDCYDIDIAIDNMLGSEFVDKVREYLLSNGEEAQGVGIIPRNPDQSKHLETARMRLFDLWIDFVNLRCEDYSENSRIPTMKFGTAEEDAYRRDLTINSLFYNINTSSVEDLTGRGIADLKTGKIVTPLPPKATFLDDPLRVLRAIRFGILDLYSDFLFICILLYLSSSAFSNAQKCILSVMII
uniref:Uncharacterized protein MANES_18G102400 n=1 Tax=Rhizophora mucronata TaxID=61149 RepID=A0A2P2KV24_RHIMU